MEKGSVDVDPVLKEAYCERPGALQQSPFRADGNKLSLGCLSALVCCKQSVYTRLAEAALQCEKGRRFCEVPFGSTEAMHSPQNKQEFVGETYLVPRLFVLTARGPNYGIQSANVCQNVLLMLIVHKTITLSYFF